MERDESPDGAPSREASPPVGGGSADVQASPDLEGLIRRGPDDAIASGRTPEDHRRMVMAMQRSAGNAAVVLLLRAMAPPQGEAASAPAATRALIVPDDGPAPGPGQMRLKEFLDTLKPVVTETAQSSLT